MAQYSGTASVSHPPAVASRGIFKHKGTCEMLDKFDKLLDDITEFCDKAEEWRCPHCGFNMRIYYGGHFSCFNCRKRVEAPANSEDIAYLQMPSLEQIRGSEPLPEVVNFGAMLEKIRQENAAAWEHALQAVENYVFGPPVTTEERLKREGIDYWLRGEKAMTASNSADGYKEALKHATAEHVGILARRLMVCVSHLIEERHNTVAERDVAASDFETSQDQLRLVQVRAASAEKERDESRILASAAEKVVTTERDRAYDLARKLAVAWDKAKGERNEAKTEASGLRDLLAEAQEALECELEETDKLTLIAEIKAKLEGDHKEGEDLAKSTREAAAEACAERAELVVLRSETVALNKLLDCRAGKLLRKDKFFVIVAHDEPYFAAVYSTIRAHEKAAGRWTSEDEEHFDQWVPETTPEQDMIFPGKEDALRDWGEVVRQLHEAQTEAERLKDGVERRQGIINRTHMALVKLQALAQAVVDSSKGMHRDEGARIACVDLDVLDRLAAELKEADDADSRG